MRAKIDETDRKILAALMEDGRIPAKSLAKNLNMHPNTLLQRMKRLERTGIVKGYCANIDYGVLGYDFQVMIMMKVTHGRTEDIDQLDSIFEMNELEALYATTGMWDILSLWRVRNKEHLNELLNKITGHPSITRTMTNTILCTYKNPRQFNPL